MLNMEQENGVIAERGTFRDLMKDSVLFSRIMDEYGSQEKEENESEQVSEETKEAPEARADKSEKKGQTALMTAEERNRGAVTGETYRKYLRFAGSILWAPYIALLMALVQGAAGKPLLILASVLPHQVNFSVQQSLPRVLDESEY